MRSIDLKHIAIKLKKEGKSYNSIGMILGLTRYAVRNLVTYKYVVHKKKRGHKRKISKAHALSIKREITRLTCKQEKVNSSKIKKNCGLTVSTRTVQRHLKLSNMKYTRSYHEILLTKKHKEERMKVITEWISSNHNWENTIFSDEKKFTLDGPDCWMTYVPKTSKYIRHNRQCHGGGIMIWLMILPNGLLSFHMISGKFKSADYITLLKTFVVPIMKVNVNADFYFQQDNCTVHKAKIVKEYLESSNISTIKWPSRSPDLNIVEDVWKMISDMVYDGPLFLNKAELENKIVDVISLINCTMRHKILDLYASIRLRLCKVLSNKGNLYNS